MEVINVSEKNQLIQLLNKCLKNGKTSQKIYFPNTTKEELGRMNDNIDEFFGYIYRIDCIGTNLYEFTLSISDNFYVLRYFKEKEDIPKDRTKAIQIMEVVQEIISEIEEAEFNDIETELYIHNYLVHNCVYGYMENEDKNDPTVDAYQTYGALINGVCVCSGISNAFRLIGLVRGIEIISVYGMLLGDHHEWNMIKLRGNWYHIDVTRDVYRREYLYYNKCDDDMTNYEWNKELYPECYMKSYQKELLYRAFLKKPSLVEQKNEKKAIIRQL